VATTHYRAEVDIAKALAGAPARERANAEAAFKLLGAAEDIPVDLYIDDADRIRRMEMKYELEVVGQSMAMELKLELFDFGAPVAFKRPPPHQVADASRPGP
jgi:hypothetical protein